MKLGQKMMKSYALDVVFIHLDLDNLTKIELFSFHD